MKRITIYQLPNTKADARRPPTAPFVIRHSSFVISRMRRGTALIFVLGVLTLLALLGLVLIARTHGEFQRVSNQAVSTSYQSALDGIVRNLQETLRRDIWGNDPNPQLPFQITAPIGSVAEVNEAWDAPGVDDRWLASLAPYDAGTSPGAGAANAFPPPIGDPTNLVGEPNVLAWPFVSYPGTDLLAPIYSKDASGNIGAQPYVWPYNSRENPPPATPAPASCRLYTAANLQNVPMLQTPPPFPPAGARLNLIPGSTTNVTIADARRDWITKMSQAPYANAVATAINAAGSPKAPQFPYFDTNADGIVDLYDADGDGIPDSPLSFVIPGDSGDPNKPKNLYAAVRIVDHSGMINVNVASSLRKAAGAPGEMSFAEARPIGPGFTLQRRGQKTSDLLLDEVVNAADRDYDTATDRCRGLTNVRSTTPDPDVYDRSAVKAKLIGGFDAASLLYGSTDEASLRHRGNLVPFDRRFDTGSDYSNIDRSLFNTLLWSRGPVGFGARWSRLDSNYLNAAGYEGYDNAGGKGWRLTMSEDEPAALRRQFFTTTSYDVSLAPDIIRRPLNANETADQAIDSSLQQLWALGMDWPVLISANSPLATDPNRPSNAFSDKFIIPAATPMPPPAFRVQQIDLNMGDSNTSAVKDSFIRYAAAAMYLSLGGINSYQGIDTSNTVAGLQNRQYLAWQFAANLADYRDLDDEPTAIQWPAATSHYIFGVERQPFMTEAYAYMTAGTDIASDKWWFAIELYVPPYWIIDPTRLSLRTSAGDFPLSSFQKVLGGGSPVMNGGQFGQYVVFCGSTNVPTQFATLGQPYYVAHQQFYAYNPALNPGFADFLLATDGTGKCELVYHYPAAPTQDHVIDVIGPQQSGPPLDSYLSGIDNANAAKWAQVNHCVTCPPAGPPSAPNCVCQNDKWEFSLLRSTNGWRFTTAWQTYHETKHSLAAGSTAPVQQSLGLPNEPSMPDVASNHTYGLSQNIPESVWPGRAPVVFGSGVWNGVNAAPASPVTGFDLAPAGAFSSFDTAGDLGKMLMVGSLVQATTPPPILVQKNAAGAVDAINAPATLVLAWIIQYGPSSNDLPAASKDRLAAGHPNFAADRCAPASAYSMKWLLSYFTTQSPLFDGVDNDGNGLVDMADPLEGYAVLNRVAGRLNVNTAPATVLRSVPYMSLLPTSAEYMFHAITNDGTNPVPPGYSPLGQFGLTAPRPFWDIATGIVATRESRRVNLRLQDPAITLSPPNVNTQMTTVAIAGVPNSVGICPSGSPAITPLKGAITTIGDLVRINDRKDLSPTNDADLFNIDRFTRNPNLIHVVNHNYAPTGDPALGPDNTATPYARLDSDLSPDFRFRRTDASSGFVEHSPVYDRNNLPIPETSGVRARDVLLSRWTNVLTTRSDVFTAYIALIDEDGHYVERSQVTLDRSPCFRERPAPIDPTGRPTQPRDMILPQILSRLDTSYSDDTK